MTAHDLVAEHVTAHKRRVSKELFDYRLREQRRNRAAASGTALFLYDRVFADIIERLSIVRRQFRTALLIGAPNPAWPAELARVADQVTAFDPSEQLARAANGSRLLEDRDPISRSSFDLCIAIGTLDTVNNLPAALANILAALRPESLLIGAISGGETLPRLRAAMRAADQVKGAASPHVHPRIDAPTLAALLSKIGFVEPVLDVDRIAVSYPSLATLVADLRAMGTTNILTDRSKKSFSRQQAEAAEANFNDSQLDGKTTEVFEIVHFAAWSAPAN